MYVLCLFNYVLCYSYLQSRRRAPMLTAPPEDHDTQHAVPLNTQATGTCSTELIHETTVVTGPSQREASRPCEGANVAVKEKDTEHSMLRGYCPRIGIRRVGLERARDLPPLSQTREQVTCQQKSGFRPPTAPGFLQAQLSSGDVSRGLLYNYSSLLQNVQPCGCRSTSHVFFFQPSEWLSRVHPVSPSLGFNVWLSPAFFRFYSFLTVSDHSL